MFPGRKNTTTYCSTLRVGPGRTSALKFLCNVLLRHIPDCRCYSPCLPLSCVQARVGFNNKIRNVAESPRAGTPGECFANESPFAALLRGKRATKIAGEGTTGQRTARISSLAAAVVVGPGTPFINALGGVSAGMLTSGENSVMPACLVHSLSHHLQRIFASNLAAHGKRWPSKSTKNFRGARSGMMLSTSYRQFSECYSSL